MKKLILSTLLFSILTFGIAQAEAKVAIVDVKALVAQSSQVQALKKENETQIKELTKWVESCKKDVARQKTQAAKDKLTKKYDEQLKRRQETIKKNYQDKLQAIDKDITDAIIKEAETKGYDLVITKQGTIIYGGVDITEDLVKVIK